MGARLCEFFGVDEDVLFYIDGNRKSIFRIHTGDLQLRLSTGDWCSIGNRTDCYENLKVSLVPKEICDEIDSLSKIERVIIQNMDKKYKWVVREVNEDLHIFEEKPFKVGNNWHTNATRSVLPFSQLFGFITPDDTDPTWIEAL